MAELERERTKRENHRYGSSQLLWLASGSLEDLEILGDRSLGLGRGMRKEKDEREKRIKERIEGPND